MLRFVLVLSVLCGLQSSVNAGVVSFQNDQLVIDGKPQPQLFGAEIQYFRLRGGQERNIPRERVLSLWAKALDRAVEAHMNTVSFYIPWDFHEYEEGKFDFDGTADDDGDGRPDFPSRDVKTFIRMIEERGIKHIMARPGPYINAEWGFLGFGAIPLWFHQKYPSSHMHNPQGQRSSLYSYRDPNFLRLAKRWLKEVHQQVIQEKIGPGQPIHFLQVDNETNFMWSGLYNHDYGELSLRAYRAFLQENYGTLANVNQAHQRTWTEWSQIMPPLAYGLNTGEDQDWYRFQDITVRDYLREIRKTWESLGVHEPTVLFTLAESYNAPEQGLLPHFEYRNEPGRTGMMTVNLYPKTAGESETPLMNLPFKSDLDVKSADTASDHYLGKQEQWVMGPEIQGGWWPGTGVTTESRRQTYLTTIGHGLKALFIYYFNEGDNWQNGWSKQQITPVFQLLHQDPRYAGFPEQSLPEEFWSELNQIVQDQFFFNWTAEWIYKFGGIHGPTLRFDAPLGPDAEVREPYEVVKQIGERVIAPYGNFLGKAKAMEDAVCFLRDSGAHAPSRVPGLESWVVNADWAGGLLAYLMHAGINPKIIHWGLTNQADMNKECRLIVYQDTGLSPVAMVEFFRAYLNNGGRVLSFLSDDVSKKLFPANTRPQSCHSLENLPLGAKGSRCVVKASRDGRQGIFENVDKAIYAELNGNDYAEVTDIPARLTLIQNILKETEILTFMKFGQTADHLVAFGRRLETHEGDYSMWITVKNGWANPQLNYLLFNRLNDFGHYQITNVLSGDRFVMTSLDLKTTGLPVRLGKYDSTAFFIEPYEPSQLKKNKKGTYEK